MKCSFASKDMFSCEDGLCTGEVGLVELKIAGGIQYPRLRGGNNRLNVLPILGQKEKVMNYIRAENYGKLDFLNSVKSSSSSIPLSLGKCVRYTMCDNIKLNIRSKGLLCCVEL